MKCGCGADYVMEEHSLGYYLRCKRWIWHQQNPNWRKKNLKKY